MPGHGRGFPEPIIMTIFSNLAHARQFRLVAISIVAVVALGVTIALLPGRKNVYRPPAELVKIQKEVDRHFRNAPKIPAADPDAVRALFMAAPVITVSDVTLGDIHRSDLAAFMADFVVSRATGDVDAYADTMRARGARIKAWDDHNPVLLGRFRLSAGRDATAQDDPNEIFRVSMEHEIRTGTRDNGPTASIAAGPHAADIQLVQIRAGDDPYDAFIPFLMELMETAQQFQSPKNIKWSDDLAQIHWYMNNSSGGVGHWAPPASLEDVLAKHGVTLVANVRFVQRLVRGATYPTTAMLYHDPDTDHWHPISIQYLNIDFTRGGGPTY